MPKLPSVPNAAHIVPFSDSLVQLRFIGEHLENRSLPIYELGTALVSLQRIISKAYVFNHHPDGLYRSTKLDRNIRESVALQIGSRRRDSGGYGLIPFLTNPYVLPVLQQVIATAITGIGAFAYYKIHQRKTSSSATTQTFIVAIYDDVRQLTDRIGGKGKIQAIEIIPSSKVDAHCIRIDIETKNYLKQIGHEPVFGPFMRIRGKLSRLYPRRFELDIISQKRRVRVRLNEMDFQTARYQAKSDAVIEFKGHPVYKLGAKTGAFKTFHAEAITLLPIDKSSLSEFIEK
jgi:hypothetical protein